MPPISAFHSLGLFVRQSFLSAEECRELSAQMLAEAGQEATVFGQSGDGGVLTDVRRAWEVDIPSDLASIIAQRLRALRGDLESHFEVRLENPDAASFLRYPKGAFYRAHRDRRETPDSSHAERRAVSVVVFVNGPHDERGFSGGNLRFYGLLGDGPVADIGIDAEPRAGTLIAFPSTLLHEVTPVESGTRMSIVTWFPERSATHS